MAKMKSVVSHTIKILNMIFQIQRLCLVVKTSLSSAYLLFTVTVIYSTLEPLYKVNICSLDTP